jgi:hypothetical protein
VKRTRVILALLTLLGLPALGPAADLTRVDRTIKKEPVYQGKPQYCLLVFGPEAKTRVWVVVDGDVLYLDRNGDGDLTGPGERIAAHDVLRRPKERPDVEVMRTFELNCWKPGAPPILTCGPEVRWFYVHQFVPRSDYPDRDLVKRWQDRPFDVAVTTKTGQCQRAALRFGDSPGHAPVLHLDGPRRFRPSDHFGPPQFRRGKMCELYAELYAPGLNATALTENYEVPKAVHPVADITFPPVRPGGKLVHVRVKLWLRC